MRKHHTEKQRTGDSQEDVESDFKKNIIEQLHIHVYLGTK